MKKIVKWEFIAAVVGIILAIVAIFQSCAASNKASEANRLAQDANNLSEKALAQAKKANDLSEEANKQSSKANEYSEKSLLAIWTPEEIRFQSADAVVKQWEQAEGLSRDGGTTENDSQLNSALDILDPPEDVRKAYIDRAKAWRNLKYIAANVQTFTDWIKEDLTVPVNPHLPRGELVPMTATSLGQITCVFAGVKTPLGVVLKGDTLQFPREFYGPDSKFFRSPNSIDIRLPVKIYRTTASFSFDVEFIDPISGTVITIQKNKWILSNYGAGIKSQSDDRRLEVIAGDGVPVFQIAIDPDQSTLYIGGRFESESGELVIALPDKLITNSVIIEGGEYLPGKYSVENLIYGPSPADVEAATKSLRPWFSYGKE